MELNRVSIVKQKTKGRKSQRRLIGHYANRILTMCPRVACIFHRVMQGNTNE